MPNTLESVHDDEVIVISSDEEKIPETLPSQQQQAVQVLPCIPDSGVPAGVPAGGSASGAAADKNTNEDMRLEGGAKRKRQKPKLQKGVPAGVPAGCSASEAAADKNTNGDTRLEGGAKSKRQKLKSQKGVPAGVPAGVEGGAQRRRRPNTKMARAEKKKLQILEIMQRMRENRLLPEAPVVKKEDGSHKMPKDDFAQKDWPYCKGIFHLGDCAYSTEGGNMVAEELGRCSFCMATYNKECVKKRRANAADKLIGAMKSISIDPSPAAICAKQRDKAVQEKRKQERQQERLKKW